MAETRISHRGHVIVIDESANPPKVVIDGEKLPVSRIAPGLYSDHSLPHINFTSLEALVKAVIDHSPAFYDRRDAKK
jgi:hypothetical protein